MELSQEDLDLLRAWTRGDYMYQRERPQRLHQLFDELAEPAPELYRGEQHDFYEAQQNWVKGARVTRELTSATEDPTQADVFVYDVMSPFDRPLRVFMQINGVKGIPLNKYLGEHEFEAQGEWLISGTFQIDRVGNEGKDSLYVWLSPVRQARTAVARPATIYRGMGVRLGDTWEERDINWGEFMDHYESGDYQAVANLVLEHVEDFGEGSVGVHWTFEDEVAERFALRARGPATVPTVLVGEVGLGQVGIEEDPSGEGYAVYDIEQEYPVKRGADIGLREVRVWVPLAGRFITIPIDRRVTAIAKQSWYRATNDISSLMEDETFVHLGTWQAATEARDLPSAMSGAESAYGLYRVDIDPKNSLPNRVHDDVANAIAVLDTYRRTGRWAEWWGERHSDEEYMVDWLLNTGRRYPEWQVDPDMIHELDAVYYENDFEDAGSTSVMVRPSAVVGVELVAEWDDDENDWVPVHEAAGMGQFMLMGPGGTEQKNLIDNPYHDPSKMAKYHEAEQTLAEFEQLLIDEYGIYAYELEDWWPKHRVPLDDIIPTQTWLDPRKFDIGEEGRSPGGPGDAVALKYGGDHFLIDGHHRYKKFIETGQDDMLVRVMDMDTDLERVAYWAATWYNKNLSDQGVFVTR